MSDQKAVITIESKGAFPSVTLEFDPPIHTGDTSEPTIVEAMTAVAMAAMLAGPRPEGIIIPTPEEQGIIIPTPEQLAEAMKLIVRDGHNALKLLDLNRMALRDPTIDANVEHFSQIFEEMRQVTVPLARSVVRGALVRGLYLGLQLRKGVL